MRSSSLSYSTEVSSYSASNCSCSSLQVSKFSLKSLKSFDIHIIKPIFYCSSSSVSHSSSRLIDHSTSISYCFTSFTSISLTSFRTSFTSISLSTAPCTIPCIFYTINNSSRSVLSIPICETFPHLTY